MDTRKTCGTMPALLFLALSILTISILALPPAQLHAQQTVQLDHASKKFNQLTAEQQQIVANARAILKKTNLSAAEQEVRLQVIHATLTGTAIRPDDDYPEMRNPKYWTISNDTFVVAPDAAPSEAISDLWVVHDNDGVPIPRIRCYKYSSLILIEGYIQYFRESGNAAGLAALNRLIAHHNIPHDLPNGGEDLLWKRRPGGENLLPGDQVWFDNPFYEQGRELIYHDLLQQAHHEGKSPEEAAAFASASTEALTVGEEGSNVFCLGDDKFIRCASSLSRLSRDALPQRANESAAAHEQVFTPKILTFTRFQEHMVDDNYSAQACMRARPASVRPEDFKIKRVRSPIGPENLLRLYAGTAASDPYAFMIEAMASRNKAPKLMSVRDATIPLFDAAYDWSEQQRVRLAIETVMRTKSDDLWWRLRASAGDGRYVLTATRGGIAKNFTLGAICSDIVDSQLCLGFTSHLPSVPGRLPATFRPEQEYLEHEAQWSRERAPLYAMQAALCQRALQQLEAVPGTLAGSDGQAHLYTADEKARCVGALKKQIAGLNETKKAVYEEVVVPWRPAPDGWEGFDAESAKEARQEYDRRSSARGN